MAALHPYVAWSTVPLAAARLTFAAAPFIHLSPTEPLFFTDPKSLTDIFPLPSVHTSSKLLHPPRLFKSHLFDSDEAHSAPGGASVQGRLHEDSVRAALEAYCTSRDPLRELRVATEAYGWDSRCLEKGEFLLARSAQEMR